ncbi:MAG: ATP-binding cassette domain-containing protein [Acaryochloridaceae cyanobacterium SU_2_1]|nr:ATP-binding cassette domain-containing protein [Acaryochloridaceae cyanobacterium SU_2_1]
MVEPLVELKGIYKAFGNHVVLQDANLQIYSGDALAILGPSGTGKSTILRIIAGLLAPDAGEVYINGQPRCGSLDNFDNPIRMSMVFQQAALFDSLSVEENVGFFLYQHSQLPRQRIRELVNEKLELVGLPGIGHLYPAELSGGMRKRVSFARAILDNPDDDLDDPKILLYDEPTAGLDPIASTMIEDLILELQRSSGCDTYALVTHQNTTIRRNGKKLVLFYQGHVQWQGTVHELEESDNAYLQQFISGSIHGPMEITDDYQAAAERSTWLTQQ